MTTTTRPRPWARLLELFPGSLETMVEAMGSNRQSVWQLRCGSHRKVPHALLGSLATAFASIGTADGSVAPTQQELTAAWLRAFRKGAS